MLWWIPSQGFYFHVFKILKARCFASLCSGSWKCGPVWAIGQTQRGFKNDRTVWQRSQIVSVECNPMLGSKSLFCMSYMKSDLLLVILSLLYSHIEVNQQERSHKLAYEQAFHFCTCCSHMTPCNSPKASQGFSYIKYKIFHCSAAYLQLSYNIVT